MSTKTFFTNSKKKTKINSNRFCTENIFHNEDSQIQSKINNKLNLKINTQQNASMKQLTKIPLQKHKNHQNTKTKINTRSKILLTENSTHQKSAKSIRKHKNNLTIHQISQNNPQLTNQKKSLEKNIINKKKSSVKNSQSKNHVKSTHTRSLKIFDNNNNNNFTKSTYLPESQQLQIQFLQKIGQGAFGTVFKAKYHDKLFAVKKVLQNQKYKNREAEIIKILNSQFIVKIHHTYITKQKFDNLQEQIVHLHIVMDLYQMNLKQLIKSRNLSPLDIKIYAYQIFRGLHYLHTLGICHRDIKPHNIMVKGKRAVICDFGCAKKISKQQTSTAYICSRCYRAPELIFGSVKYTQKIDIWSAGCVLLELYNGKPMFLGQNNVQQLFQIIKILGTPSQNQIFNMNNEYNLQHYRFPKIKSKSWSQIFPKIGTQSLDLISKIMVYSPNQRLNTSEILSHPYFDELKTEKNRKYLKEQNLCHLLKQSKQQVQGIKNRLISKK